MQEMILQEEKQVSAVVQGIVLCTAFCCCLSHRFLTEQSNFVALLQCSHLLWFERVKGPTLVLFFAFNLEVFALGGTVSDKHLITRMND